MTSSSRQEEKGILTQDFWRNEYGQPTGSVRGTSFAPESDREASEPPVRQDNQREPRSVSDKFHLRLEPSPPPQKGRPERE